MAAPLPEPLTERDRLMSRLDDHQIAVIRAPVGFGKTTLAAQWARRQPADRTIAWVRVGAHAGDVDSFWVSVVDALTDSGRPLPPLAQHRSPQALAARMIAAGGPLTLIIDSFENINGNTVDRELLDLVTDTAAVRLIACLRSHRPFAPYLLDDRDATVITAQDLLFTLEETTDLFARFGLDPRVPYVEMVQEATAGWPEPTRTLARTVRDTHPLPVAMASLAGRVASDFLRHKLLPEIDRPELLEFAILTALPEEINGPIAELLTGEASATSYLKCLDGEGVLISITREGETLYRWPAAARQALLIEGERRFGERLPDLRARLARWYLAEGKPAAGLHLATAAGDHRLVVEILDQHWRELLMGHRDELHAALTATPVDALAASARALAVRDLWLPAPDDRILSVAALPADEFDLINLGRSEQAREILDTGLAVQVALRRRGRFDLAYSYAGSLLQIAATARAARPDTTLDLVPSVQLTAGQTFLLAGDLRGCREPLQHAYESAADSPLDYIRADAAASLALVHAVTGETGLARTWLDRYTSAPTPSTWLEPTISGKATVARLLMCLDRLALDEARILADAMPDSDRIAADEWWAFRLSAYMRLALHADPSSGLDLLDHAPARHHTREARGGIATPLLAVAHADLLLALGRADQARSALDSVGHDHPLLRVSRARLALLTGELAVALRLAADSTWQREAKVAHRLDMLLIHAVAAHRGGDNGAAGDALQQAVDIARSSAALRPFTTVPRADLDELASTVPAAAALLAAPPLATARDTYPATITQVRLTQRERRVLEHLAAGLTVQQTATALVVSYNTVKTQISSVYRKLGATHRTDAVARAHQWGLLGNHRSDSP